MDSTQLEDWVVDIETAGNLTVESRTKLAQAKSKGLTCTLITEAITSGKSWDDIKDLLQLKICNSNIQTAKSTFLRCNRKKKNPSQHTFTILKEKLKDVILQITMPS